MIKIKGLFITILALVICLAGCKSKQDTLKFIYENVGLPNKECASYEVNIGNKVEGQLLLQSCGGTGSVQKVHL